AVQLINGHSVTDRSVLHGVGVATTQRVLVHLQPKEGCYECDVGSGYKRILQKIQLIETGDNELIFQKAIMEQGRWKGLEKKLLHIVGYNKNSESESVKQDGELMNASEI
ncbi:hypothetical protein IGI04_039540, partial [Brassica rapa subsp. trilocularis]